MTHLRTRSGNTRVFLLSGVDDTTRKDLARKIAVLGGKYFDLQGFKAVCSHVICGKLSRSEKFLGACATGKWVLHPAYIHQSVTAGVWLDEEQFEWCDENITRRETRVDPELSLAPRRWRFLLGDQTKAFTGWKVAVVFGAKRSKVINRLLISGGAEVFNLKLPVNNPEKVANTIGYIFVSEQNVSQVARMFEYGVLCVKPEFIGDYLIKDPPADPMDYLVSRGNTDTVTDDIEDFPSTQESFLPNDGSSQGERSSQSQYLSQGQGSALGQGHDMSQVTQRTPIATQASSALYEETNHPSAQPHFGSSVQSPLVVDKASLPSTETPTTSSRTAASLKSHEPLTAPPPFLPASSKHRQPTSTVSCKTLQKYPDSVMDSYDSFKHDLDYTQKSSKKSKTKGRKQKHDPLATSALVDDITNIPDKTTKDYANLLDIPDYETRELVTPPLSMEPTFPYVPTVNGNVVMENMNSLPEFHHLDDNATDKHATGQDNSANLSGKGKALVRSRKSERNLVKKSPAWKTLIPGSRSSDQRRRSIATITTKVKMVMKVDMDTDEVIDLTQTTTEPMKIHKKNRRIFEEDKADKMSKVLDEKVRALVKSEFPCSTPAKAALKGRQSLPGDLSCMSPITKFFKPIVMTTPSQTLTMSTSNGHHDLIPRTNAKSDIVPSTLESDSTSMCDSKSGDHHFTKTTIKKEVDQTGLHCGDISYVFSANGEKKKQKTQDPQTRLSPCVVMLEDVVRSPDLRRSISPVEQPSGPSLVKEAFRRIIVKSIEMEESTEPTLDNDSDSPPPFNESIINTLVKESASTSKNKRSHSAKKKQDIIDKHSKKSDSAKDLDEVSDVFQELPDLPEVTTYNTGTENHDIPKPMLKAVTNVKTKLFKETGTVVKLCRVNKKWSMATTECTEATVSCRDGMDQDNHGSTAAMDCNGGTGSNVQLPGTKSSTLKRKCRPESDLLTVLSAMKRQKISTDEWRPTLLTYDNQQDDETLRDEMPQGTRDMINSSLEEGLTLTALEEINNRISLKYYPEAPMIWKMLQILLEAEDELQSNFAYQVLHRLLQLHPPVTEQLQSVYMAAIGSQGAGDKTVGQEWELIQTCIGFILKEGNTTVRRNNIMLLRILIQMLEVNLQHYINSSKVTETGCHGSKHMLLRILWCPSYHMVYNKRCRELMDLMLDVINLYRTQDTQTDTDTLLDVLQDVVKLVAMAAECCRAAECVGVNSINCLAAEKTAVFVHEIARRVGSIDDCAVCVRVLSSLQLPWLQVGVVQQMLNNYDDYLLTEDHIKDTKSISMSIIVSRYLYLLPRFHIRVKHNAAIPTTSSVTPKRQRQASGKGSSPPKLVYDSTDMDRDGYEKLMMKVNKRNAKGETALHAACIKNDVATLTQLLAVPGVDVNVADNAGWTAVHEACNRGHTDCVKLLLKFVPSKTVEQYFSKDNVGCRKVNLLAVNTEGITPLHDAVLNNQLETCRLLLQHGGARLLSAVTSRGFTPLVLAETDEMFNLLYSFQPTQRTMSVDSQDSFISSQGSYVSIDGFRTGLPSDHLYEEVTYNSGTRVYADSSGLRTYTRLILDLIKYYITATQLDTVKHNMTTLKVARLKSKQNNNRMDIDNAGDGLRNRDITAVGDITDRFIDVKSHSDQSKESDKEHVIRTENTYMNIESINSGAVWRQGSAFRKVAISSKDLTIPQVSSSGLCVTTGDSVASSFSNNSRNTLVETCISKDIVQETKRDLRILKNLSSHIDMFKSHLYKICRAEDHNLVESVLLELSFLAEYFSEIGWENIETL